MSNLEVFCIVAAGGACGGILAWLSWSFGFESGGKFGAHEMAKHWEASAKACSLPARVLTNAATPTDDCKCGGLCPGCALPPAPDVICGVQICEFCGSGLLATSENWLCPECGRREDF